MDTYTQNQERRREKQAQLDEIAVLQQECSQVPPKVARQILMANYPQRPESFFKRNLRLILTLDPDQLIQILGHKDPTGETAVNNVLEGATA